MKYFFIEPEVAGELGSDTIIDTMVHPPLVSKLNYHLTGWLGDSLLESFPCFIVTDEASTAMINSGLSGFSLHGVEITKSQEFDSLYPSKILPKFHWMKVTGKPGHNDFGIAPDHRLVISESARHLLMRYSLNHAVVENFDR